MISNVDSENRTINNITWNKDMNSIVNTVDNDENRLAAQFRFFAEFWLNKLNINSGFTNVYDLSGNLGRYDFSRNNTIYTGKFNGFEWSWDTIDYCFNTVNSKRQNKCLGRWVYNKDNGKCYPPLNSESTCSNYEYKTMYNYVNQTDINNWMTRCNVSNSENCKLPREGQLPFSSQPITSSSPIGGSPAQTPASPSGPVGGSPASPSGPVGGSPAQTPARTPAQTPARTPAQTPASTATPTSLYNFTTHTFTNCDIEGPRGPKLEKMRKEYNSAWTLQYINMVSDNGIQLWTVPTTGNYLINAIGAAGGNSNIYGKGRSVQLITTLYKGEIIKILVGQTVNKSMVNNILSNSGGGGGTYVMRDYDTPIIIAGGGGGRGYNDKDNNANANANSSENGNDGAGIIGFGDQYQEGGNRGSGGGNSPSAGGGAGFSSGGWDFGNENQTGGLSPRDGYGWGGGGFNINIYWGGGFGGGGACIKGKGGGGGGGYSGGGGGGWDPNVGWLSGGGGGSFGITTLTDNGAINEKNGSVIIKFLSV